MKVSNWIINAIAVVIILIYVLLTPVSSNAGNMIGMLLLPIFLVFVPPLAIGALPMMVGYDYSHKGYFYTMIITLSILSLSIFGTIIRLIGL